ncbi:PQQ-binding-like beta-propeller repeat protein [Acidobacteriota bacterium]
MNKRHSIIIVISVCLLLLSVQSVSAQNWPQWRGPLATGEVKSGNPPIEWSEQNNVRWKTQLSGTGHSTPAVWKNLIFVTAAQTQESNEGSRGIVKATQPVKFLLIAVDRETGKVKWERLAREEIPHQSRNNTGAWATASPITDGERVYAFFGSRGLYCYDFEGKLIWEKDFGDMDTQGDMGEGASPALYKDKLIVQWDHFGEDFIVALDAPTGREIWRKKRDERISWTTPLIVEDAGQVQVITVAEKWIQSYDITNGDVIWQTEGIRYNNISTPVAANGIVYVGSGLQRGWVKAIRLKGAKGNITGTSSVLWTFEKFYPYVPSPLVMGGLLYFTKDRVGYLTCLDAATGEVHYSNKRMQGIRHIFASPTGVKDRIYFLGRNGVTVVIRHGSEFQVLSTNTLEDEFDSTPVIVGDEIYLRGHQYLYCISK